MSVRSLKYGDYNDSGKYVVYLITREYRMQNNWSLIEAAGIAKANKKKLIVLVFIDGNKDSFNEIQFPFLVDGVKKLNEDLQKKNISMQVLKFLTVKQLNQVINLNSIFHLVTDLFPLKIYYEFIKKVKTKLSVSIVDAHNIVPCFIASNKQEYGAYTIRPKIKQRLNEYLTDYPELPSFGKDNLEETLSVSETDKANLTPLYKGGYEEALKTLDNFIKKKLEKYSSDRNNPVLNGTSNLSPYLHFGFISSQEIALKISNLKCNQESKEAFLEELIIRKELSDNYCFYNKDYDSIIGIPPWAMETLNKHRIDKREFIYSYSEYKNAETYDELWNSAQRQLSSEGKIHGYLRMYWAKKILEWSETPEAAFDAALKLNDNYAIDGIDPNGYVGVAWSIGGVHDRAWQEREVFGKIRYMNYNGCKRKFDVAAYIEKYGG